jgi:YbgC/YbaW family acyl-CoA thioester hydrolase
VTSPESSTPSRIWPSFKASGPKRREPRALEGVTLSIAETEIEARAYELDSFGHINHAVYLNYFEQARFEVLARAGFTYEELFRRGWAIHVIRVEVDYHREVLLGDRLRIRTWIEEFGRVTMILRQAARREPRTGEAQREAQRETQETLVAEARVEAVWIGENGRPMRVPSEVREDFGKLEAWID